ncbi:hypothetical protein Pelo_19497 [Pelomyxa schiedti]|nr:hypothetical protein Pelo_19497 [Pelomyxa schiedti]
MKVFHIYRYASSMNVKWNVFSVCICTFLKGPKWEIRDSKRLFAREVTPSRFGNIHKWIGITLERYWLANPTNNQLPLRP